MNCKKGPGDSVTWGPVTSSADPRSESWTFAFFATIGMGSAIVDVRIEFYDEEPDGMIESVVFEGTDIATTITDETEASIRKQAKVAYAAYIEKGADE